MRPALVNADWNYWPEDVPPEAIWASCSAIGFDGIELGVYDPADQLSDARVATYRALADRFGVPVAAVLYSMPPGKWPGGGLGHPDSAPAAVEAATACGRIAREAFGLDALGVWPGADVLNRRTHYENSWRNVVDAVRTLARNLAPDGMRVSIEYKPRDLIGNADAALRLCDAIDAPNVGVLLDTGHALWAGEDLPVVVHMLGDRLFHLHLGDTPGDIDRDLPPGWNHDFTSFVAALDEIGYRGQMSLDMYGSILERVLSAEEASRIGFDNMVAAAERARRAR